MAKYQIGQQVYVRRYVFMPFEAPESVFDAGLYKGQLKNKALVEINGRLKKIDYCDLREEEPHHDRHNNSR